MRLETIFSACYAYGMENLPEIELLGSRQWHREIPPGTFFDPGDATYQLLFIASGLRRGRLHLPDGRNPYHVPPQGAEGLLLLVPPGSDFTGGFEAEETEARVFSFRCPTLRPDEIRPRCLFGGPAGAVQAVDLAYRLSAYEVTILRPLSEELCMLSGPGLPWGARLKARCLLLAILTRLFIGAEAPASYRKSPGMNLEKLIETSPRGTTLEEMARALGHSTNWLRRHFENQLGRTPSSYRTSQTLHLARYYILRTQMPFKEICRRLGFSSPSVFSRFIRQQTGKSPRALRAVAGQAKARPAH